MMETGKCAWGENCWFEHEIEGVMKSITIKEGVNQKESNENPINDPKNEKKGIQSNNQLYMLYSLANQMKIQSDQITNLQRMMTKRM